MALEALWVAWKKHQHRAGQVIVGILLFAAGWQAGRVMSPYYAASPIVFQEAPGTPANSNNGSAEALIALQQAGMKNNTAPASAQVAAATTASPTSAAQPGEPRPEGRVGDSASPTTLPPPLTPPQAGGEQATRLFVGSKNSNLYHHKDCPSAKRIKEDNQIWWPTKEAAEAAGYSPSKCTQDKI